MPSRGWVYWLGAMGAGACIALGAGSGVAMADPDTTDRASASSQTVDRSRDDSSDRDAQQATSTDPATVPSDAEDADARDVDAEDADALEAAEADGQDAADPDAPAGSAAEVAPEADSGAPTESTTSVPQQDSTDATTAPVAEAVTDGAVESPTTPADTSPATDPVAPAVLNTVSALGAAARPETQAVPTVAGPVTGVQTGRARLTIPLGADGFTTRADWYLPTQADGSVAPTGVIWLQHGFLGNKSFLSALATRLSQQTNSIVVAPNLPSFPLACSSCWINGVPMQQAVATMFLGDRTSLNASAMVAGYLGTLPENFILSGQSAGGGFAAAAGGYYATDPGNDDSLRGVVMFDGFARNGVVPDALERLQTLDIPVYQIAAPAQPWNSFGKTTAELVAARPGQFVGVTLAGGSHSDSLIGANPILDLVLQLVTGFSPAGNTEAVYTLATGWINDLYQGLGPADGAGIYGAPDQYIVMGEAAAVVLGPAPIVDLDRYLGTWYEVGSVKQFFSIGLVNTTAVYSLNADGSVRVENSGNYFFDNGPKSSIVGVALPVDATNNKLNVRFFGPASANPPGNYWIVDLDPDYQWAVVSDSTGLSGFLLSRTRTVSDDLYQQLLDRASVKGVKGRITPTRQPAADSTTV